MERDPLMWASQQGEVGGPRINNLKMSSNLTDISQVPVISRQ